MIDYIDILITRLAIWNIKKGYGADCVDFDENCPSCKAKKTIQWLEDHIELIKLIRSK